MFVEEPNGFDDIVEKKRRRGNALCVALLDMSGIRRRFPFSSVGWPSWNIAGTTRPESRCSKDRRLKVRRSVGKLANLQQSLKNKELNGTLGIVIPGGHSRQAVGAKCASPSFEGVRVGAQRHHRKLSALETAAGKRRATSFNPKPIPKSWPISSTSISKREGVGRCGSCGDEGCAWQLCAGCYF